jgi:hypothetical protein
LTFFWHALYSFVNLPRDFEASIIFFSSWTFLSWWKLLSAASWEYANPERVAQASCAVSDARLQVGEGFLPVLDGVPPLLSFCPTLLNLRAPVE